MKSFDRIPFLANVLIVACSRPNAEVGKLVKAVVTYATEGIKTDLGDLRLEAYFDLLIQDIDSLRIQHSAFYDINGRRIARSQRGINIVRQANGTVKKMMVK